jgi:hypothetical protein
MKLCKGCGGTFAVGNFYKNPNVRDGYLNYCKRCVVKRYGPGRSLRQRELLAYIQQIKVSRGCTDCGYNVSPEALDFDHLPGVDKEYRLATMAAGSSKARIDREIAKCEVVCANCHRIRTAQRREAKAS